MATGEIDEQLRAYLNADDEVESSRLLDLLLRAYAQPIICEIVTFKLRAHSSLREADDAEDVTGEIVLRLVNRLRLIKENPAANLINNLRSYVAVMAYNACDEYLRRKYPKRYSLKNQLRYLLTHHKGFALWESDDKRWLCGINTWLDSNDAARRRPRVEDLPVDRKDLARQIELIFESAGGPVELDDLVSAVARLWQIKDEPASDAEIERATVDPSQSLDAAIDQRALVARLWEEICLLPLRQRVALLFSLRDASGQSVMTLLPLTRVATVRRIAMALEIEAEELAALWDRLPLEDALIAERLSVTRQQVINLRKSARERLARRTKDFDL